MKDEKEVKEKFSSNTLWFERIYRGLIKVMQMGIQLI